MLRTFLITLGLILAFTTGPGQAADRADEYKPFSRLTDNYEISSRKQNYDEVKFPISINKKQAVEGEKIVIEYGYKNSSVNASRLQFQRHFEKLMASVSGELVFAGKTDDYDYAFTFRFPKNGKTAWVVASTTDSRDIYHYKLVIVESVESWGGAAPVARPVEPAPIPVPVAPPPRVVTPAPAPVAVPPAVAWNGGEWKEVDYGGCDVKNIMVSKRGVPDDDFCDADMSGKVAICEANGCVYKNVTPKQCKNGSNPGRMYVCVGR